jgi:hypothetical protein
MGLIEVTDSFLLEYDLLTNKFPHVIAVYTEDEIIKLYYSNSDSKKELENIMDKEGVSPYIKNAIVNAIGFKLTSYKDTSPAGLSATLPGVNLIVKHPVTGFESRLRDIIIDLNDFHTWSREAIADWIENVADTKDIAFPTPPEVNDEIGKLSKTTKVVKIKRILSR